MSRSSNEKKLNAQMRWCFVQAKEHTLLENPFVASKADEYFKQYKSSGKEDGSEDPVIPVSSSNENPLIELFGGITSNRNEHRKLKKDVDSIYQEWNDYCD